jgi:hypothetical protein
MSRLERKFDLMLKLLAIDRLKGMSQIDQVDLLDRYGFQAPEIASVLNITGESVRAQKSKAKKRRKGDKR